MQGPRGEQHDNAEPEEGLQSGLETRTWFQRKDFEVKKMPLRLISTAGKGEFKTYRNRYQLTFGRKAKKEPQENAKDFTRINLYKNVNFKSTRWHFLRYLVL